MRQFNINHQSIAMAKLKVKVEYQAFGDLNSHVEICDVRTKPTFMDFDLLERSGVQGLLNFRGGIYFEMPLYPVQKGYRILSKRKVLV
jgi:hypothetical protein